MGVALRSGALAQNRSTFPVRETILPVMLLGIDIGGTKTSVCIGDRDGRIAAARRISTRADDGPARTLARAADLTGQLLQEHGVPLASVDAVGLSVPGPVSVPRGLMLAPPNMPGWIDVPVAAFFRERLKRPLYMNNDANACVLAEFLFGEFKGAPDLVYLTMSTGLGGGIMANGRLVQGATDTAGEVGHHVLDIHGPPCPCGQRGCWELYCGGRNVARRIQERLARDTAPSRLRTLAGDRPDQLDFKMFVEAVREDDPLAREMWDEYVERLAQGIGTVIMFLNPRAIVLGTIAIHAGDLILPALARALPRYAWAPGLQSCAIRPSALGKHIGDLSALALAILGPDAGA
jgi:glucokinase